MLSYNKKNVKSKEDKLIDIFERIVCTTKIKMWYVKQRVLIKIMDIK